MQSCSSIRDRHDRTADKACIDAAFGTTFGSLEEAVHALFLGEQGDRHA